MTLVDAGPLVALIDAGERTHETFVLALATLQLPLLDDDFGVCRLRGRHAFEVVPQSR